MNDSGFKDMLKSRVDIVRTIGDYTPLKKVGGTSRYIGLCPFHKEKSPSFNVNSDKQFFKCFGCGKGGDVFNFVMDFEGLSFYEALKLLAEKNGVAMPTAVVDSDPESRRRTGIQELHEIAAKHFRESLFTPSGEAARAYLNKRGVGQKLAEDFLLGYSDPQNSITRLFQRQGVDEQLLEPSGLVLKRNDGPGFFDRFRNRLMFPIWNESGKVIAFGGRSLGDDQPKYLNSPETPIYRKSHVLYNLHRAKKGARESGRVVLVEGYMDVIGAFSAGVREVVASCGTALTSQQVSSIKRLADRVIVNFDPDAAGANAAERGIDVLLEESLQIRVCSLPGGLDPDDFVKANGAEAYLAQLANSPGYFHWLSDRARSRFDMRDAEGRMEAFRFLLPAIQKLPDKLERLAVVNDMAAQLRVDPGVVLDQFRKAASDRGSPRALQAAAARSLPELDKLLIRLLLHHPAALAGYAETILGLPSFEKMESHKILDAALRMLEVDGAVDFSALQARLSEADAHLLAALFSTDTEEVDRTNEDPAAQVRACLEKLDYDHREGQRKELRIQVREAERRGDLSEAMRLMELEQKLERADKR